MTIGALPAFVLYRSIEQTGDKRFEQFSGRPDVRKEIEYFNKRVSEVTSPEELIDDRRALQFILSAYSLDEEINYLGRMKKVLLSDTTDRSSLANRLVDPRFKTIAAAFDFANSGVQKLSLASFRQDLEQRYLTNEWEKSLGEQNPALREVAYFKRNISTAQSTFNLLGDKVFRQVVTATIGLPPQLALQSVEAQARAVEARVSVEDFKDSKFVERFVQRYLILKDAEASAAGGFSGGGSNSWQLSLLGGRTQGINLLV